jgi:hypothetical protein
MRKLIFVLTFVLAALGVTTPVANAATSQPQPSSSATPNVTCKNWKVFIILYDDSYGWAKASSPHTLYFKKSGGETRFCESGPGPSQKYTQYGTSRCMYASGSDVTEGNCAHGEAKWDHIIISSGPYAGYAMEKSDYNHHCIWWNGDNSPMKLKACDTANPQDLFY